MRVHSGRKSRLPAGWLAVRTQASEVQVARGKPRRGHNRWRDSRHLRRLPGRNAGLRLARAAGLLHRLHKERNQRKGLLRGNRTAKKHARQRRAEPERSAAYLHQPTVRRG